jgi:hypothetical protein
MIVYTLVCSVLFAASLKPLISPGALHVALRYDNQARYFLTMVAIIV